MKLEHNKIGCSPNATKSFVSEIIVLLNRSPRAIFKKSGQKRSLKNNWLCMGSRYFQLLDLSKRLYFRASVLIVFLFLRIKRLLVKHKPKVGNGGKKKVLIISITGIGDFVIFSAILEGIRKLYDNSEITLLGLKHLETLVQKCPFIDKYIPLDISAFFRYPFYKLSIFEKIQTDFYHVAYYPSFTRTVIGDVLMRACFAQEKIGYDGDFNEITGHDKKKGNQIYSRLVRPNPQAAKELDHYYHFADNLGIAKKYQRLPRVWIDDDDRCKAISLLRVNGIGDNDRFAVICPGAGVKKKLWHMDGFGKIVDYFDKKGVKIVITGRQ